MALFPIVAGLQGEAERAAHTGPGGSETGSVGGWDGEGTQATAGSGTKCCSNICPAPPSELWNKQQEQPLLSHEC